MSDDERISIDDLEQKSFDLADSEKAAAETAEAKELLCSRIPFPDKELKEPLENPDVVLAALTYPDVRLFISFSPSVPPRLYTYTLGGALGLETTWDLSIGVSDAAVQRLKREEYLKEKEDKWWPYVNKYEYTLSNKGWKRFKDLERQYLPPEEE